MKLLLSKNYKKMDNKIFKESENNKETDSTNSQKKKLSFLLLPKKEYNINKDKFNYNNEEMNVNEKKFYKTTGKGFDLGGQNKKYFGSNIQKQTINNFIQKRIHSSTNDNKNFYNLNKMHKENIVNFKSNDNENILLLKNRINEIEKELEHNENTFIYNHKIMQKKLDEKELIISRLSKKLQNVTENNKKDSEISINNIKKNYL